MRPTLELTGSKEDKSKYSPPQTNAVNEAPLLGNSNHHQSNNVDHHHEVSGGTTTAAVFGIIKAMVGPAILYLPHSFADAGYAFAIIALWVCTALYLFTANRLLTTWKYVVQSQPGRRKQPEAVSPSSSSGGDSQQQQQQQQQEDGYNSYMEFEMTNLTAKGGVGQTSPTNTAAVAVASSSSQHHPTITKRRNTNKQLSAADSVCSENSSSNDKEVTIYDVESSPATDKTTSISYSKLARMAYGDLGESIVRTGITLMQLGVCLTYFIFVPHNLSTSIHKMTKLEIPFWICLVGMVVIEIPLSSIRNVSKLVTTNVIATCLIGFGLAACLFLATEYYTAEYSMVQGAADAVNSYNNNNNNNGEGAENENYDDDMWEQEYTVPAIRHLSPWNDHWYLFIGTSVLLFEGSITLCLPLQEALEVPDAATRFPVLYNQTITSIVLFYTVFGYLCWSAFGDDVSTVLTTSLPEGILATMVQLAYSVAVVFTFPLQIFPALEIIVQTYETHLQGDTDIVVQLDSNRRRLVVAVVIVLLAFIAQMEKDNLGKVVSLMGSLLGCPLAFVFPPLIHSKLVPNANKKLDSMIAGFGVMAMIGATLITLVTWKEAGEQRRLVIESSTTLTRFFQ
ncbi:unnamed protein product [Cylindrotheca closterium]|uniref:Amino acid transporter transmembrane domain-containing protein n=1 Tax=Cylindrotheca closterium TaxID=2856 RepID=A0AAD2CMC4_9STRA|nr:unnamed protein product [Cylindrotheca closterium]